MSVITAAQIRVERNGLFAAARTVAGLLGAGGA